MGVIERAKQAVKEIMFEFKYGMKKTHEIYIEGEKVCFSVEDEASKRWFYPRYADSMHEPGTTQVFAHLAKKSNVIFDVGSHIGWFSCIAGVISDGQVHSFEMNKKYYERSIRNTKINGIDNINVQNIAVTRSKGVEEFDEDHSSLFGKVKNGIKIKSTSLDNYSEEKEIRPDLIKIDVEGKEVEVIKGAKNTIQKSKPKMIIELHPNYLKEASEGMDFLFSFLERKEYEVWKIKDFREERAKSEKIELEDFRPSRNTSILAQPKE